LRTSRVATNEYHTLLAPAFIFVLALAAVHIVTPVFAVTGSATPLSFIDEHNVPTPNSAPLAITVDRNGVVWFTESNVSKLGRFDPRNDHFNEYVVPGVGDMWGITIDNVGDVWLTQYSGRGSVNPGGAIVPGGNGRLIRFNPTNSNFTAVDIPTPGSFPFRIITDAKGRVWFTELLGNRVGFYDPISGKLQEYGVPTQFAGPADLTFDNHGTLWFTEAYNQSVARFDLQTEAFIEYHFSSIDPTQDVTSPVGISVSQDGTVWVADHGGNWIVEFNSTSQQIIRYPTHQPPAQVYPISIPNGLLIDDQGRVWFSEHGGNSVGFLDPASQSMVEFAIPTGPISTALWIALAPDGNVWFTEWSGNKIGVVQASQAAPFTVTVSQNHLDVQPGGQASLSLQANNLQHIIGYAAYVYSWPSYNLREVNVAFSPQNTSLTDLAGTSSQVRIAISHNAAPGRYVLGLGLDAGTVRVWAMLQIQVKAEIPLISLLSNTGGLIGVTLAGLAVVFLLQRRFRRKG
jgi:virginiamycin B lyase